MSHGAPNAMTTPKPTSPVRSSDLLVGLQDRFLRRAVGCSTYKQDAISKGWWHEAHEAEVRRGIWLMAAEMTSQEQCEANTAEVRDRRPSASDLSATANGAS